MMMLCRIIHDYFTLFAIIAIIPYYHYSQRSRSAFSEHSQNKTAGMGNTPRVSCWRRIPAAWSSRSVIDMDLWFLGSAHGVPTDAMCLRWTSMACRESNSALHSTHLKPNAIGKRLGPSGFPLPAPRRMMWIAFNWLQFSTSGQLADNCNDTGNKHDAKRNKRTTLCIATKGSVACKCTHHGLVSKSEWKNIKNVRKISERFNRGIQSKLWNAMWLIAHSPNTQGTLTLDVKHS
jgi:hypothetical protein